MPVHDGIVGPIPEGRDPEAFDKLRRRVLWAMPSGLYVVGSRAGGRRNAMTLNWATQVSSDPKLLAVGVQKDAFTHELIVGGQAFSLCIVDREDQATVRKFTKPVEVDEEARTLNGFAFSDTPVTGVPVLDQAVAWVDCRVHTAVDLGEHTLFVGEVVDASFAKAEDTPVLRMEDTRMHYGG